jgi:hypothetical protein
MLLVASGTPNAPSMMIGWDAADMIKVSTKSAVATPQKAANAELTPVSFTPKKRCWVAASC